MANTLVRSLAFTIVASMVFGCTQKAEKNDIAMTSKSAEVAGQITKNYYTKRVIPMTGLKVRMQ
jgi:hypothetical protein